MSIVVTGATGALGRLVVEHLLDDGPGRPGRRGRPRQGEGRPLAARGVELVSPTTTTPRPSPARSGPATGCC